jgi:hypothetical protein
MVLFVCPVAAQAAPLQCHFGSALSPAAVAVQTHAANSSSPSECSGCRQLAVCSGIVSIKRSSSRGVWSDCCGTDGDAWASHFGQDIGANSDTWAIVLSLLIWVSMTGLARARGTKVGCAVNARFAGLRMVVCALCGSLGRVRSQETRQITRYRCCPNYRRWCSLL